MSDYDRFDLGYADIQLDEKTHFVMANWPLISDVKIPERMSKQLALRSAVRSVAFSRRTRHTIDRHGPIIGPLSAYAINVLTHRKKGAPPWKSDSSYAMRCARGHVKIQSELSSRSVCVVCYREISRPE